MALPTNRESVRNQLMDLREKVQVLDAAIDAACAAGPHQPSWTYVWEKADTVARIGQGIAHDADLIARTGTLD